MDNLKVNSNQDKDKISSNSTSSSKPTGTPSSDKDFKKILGGKGNRQDSEKDSRKFSAGLDGTIEYEELAQAEENVKSQQPSLFDLSKNRIKKDSNDETADVVKMASADELPLESPTSIFKNLALKEKAKISDAKEEDVSQKMGNVDLEKSKPVNRFPQESIDLSYVNPLAINTNSIAEANNQKLETAVSSQKMTMQQLVDEIVKAIVTVESQGKTDTVVTLKQPPMFADANIILTSYETAKGEFNIRFENLTQEAKAFMDMQQNKESLFSALQQKGYAVHIIVATTQIETPQIAASNPQQTSRDSQEQQQQGQQQQGRRRRKNEDQEEA